MKEKIFEYIRNQYGADPEYLWEKFPDYAIFRHTDNKKWFALVASIGRDKLGLDGKGYIDVINLKINDPMLQDELIHENGIFSAYHMNKRSWISIILDDSLSDDEVITYIDRSYELTKDSRVWVIPANPKIYNIEKYIKGKKKIYWPRHKSILLNDIVYI